MKVSIVVPTLNEEGYVGRLLESISRQTFSPEEVIVVDGGSRDDTVRVVEEYAGVGLVHGAPPVAGQRNLGAYKASVESDVLLFLDADVELPATFLESFAGEFSRRRLACCGFHYVPYHPTSGVSPVTRMFFRTANAVFRASQGTRFASASGHGIAVNAGSFHQVGGFDESMQFDDMELIRRLAKKEWVGIVGTRLLVSDRRWRKFGALRMGAMYSLLSLSFLVNRARLGNLWDYEWGQFPAPDTTQHVPEKKRKGEGHRHGR